MQSVNVTDLIQALEVELARGGDPIVATDADGTIWSGDVGDDFYRAMVHGSSLTNEALDVLRAIAGKYNVDSAGEAREIAERLFRAYEEGHFPEDQCCAMIAQLSTGWSVPSAEAFCDELAAKRDIRGRVHPEWWQVASYLEQNRIPLWVVSASPVWVVRAGIRAIGVTVAGVLGVDLERRPVGPVEFYSAVLKVPMPYNDGKVQSLSQASSGKRIALALGDNVFDLPMLSASALPIAVRPKKRLLDVAEKEPRLRRLVA